MINKVTLSLVQKTSNFLGNVFSLIYLLLFIPALLFIPPLGAFVADANIPNGGVLFCILLLTIIPLSMPVSIYFIYARSIDKCYGKTLFFCFFPLLCSILAFFVISIIVYIHDLLPQLLKAQ